MPYLLHSAEMRYFFTNDFSLVMLTGSTLQSLPVHTFIGMRRGLKTRQSLASGTLSEVSGRGETWWGSKGSSGGEVSMRGGRAASAWHGLVNVQGWLVSSLPRYDQ